MAGSASLPSLALISGLCGVGMWDGGVGVGVAGWRSKRWSRVLIQKDGPEEGLRRAPHRTFAA